MSQIRDVRTTSTNSCRTSILRKRQMGHADEVKRRGIEEAEAAGHRWQESLGRRAEAVRRLKRGGPEHADTPERVSTYRAREAAKRIVYARAGVSGVGFA